MNLSDAVRLLRPRQWIKSAFVLVGVLFANAWREPHMLERALAAAAAFALVSSGVYVLNDILDRELDRHHPRKQLRPVASGRVSLSAAVAIGVLLFLVGFFTGWYVSAAAVLILGLYVALNLAYSLGLKRVAVLDVFLIASGFMLRLLAGTAGLGIAPSQWLLLCGLLMALFLGFAKRRAELYALGDGPLHRKVLGDYQPVFLDKMIVLTGSCVVLSYALYTMSPVTIQTHRTDKLIYTVPFVIYGICRYIYVLHAQNAGGDPAQDIFRDPHLVVSLVGWLVTTVWLIG